MRTAAALFFALATATAWASDAWLGASVTITTSGASAVNASTLPGGTEVVMQCRVGDTAVGAAGYYKACTASAGCTATVDDLYVPEIGFPIKLKAAEQWVAFLPVTAGTIKCRFYRSDPPLLR